MAEQQKLTTSLLLNIWDW